MIPAAKEISALLDRLAKGEAEAVRKACNSWLPGLIDHTLLKPEASEAQLKVLCQEARKYKFATVCVNAQHVEFCTKELMGSEVNPIAVVGFPLGATTRAVKTFEAREAVHRGAKEIDMVLAVGALKDRKHRAVYLDIRKIVTAVHPVPVKVILETALLTSEEKLMACALAKAAEAAFVKTSTGFSTGGASVADIELMRAAVGPDMGVKASGGVRTLEDALKMVLAGATRIGTSNGVTIVAGGEGSKGY